MMHSGKAQFLFLALLCALRPAHAVSVKFVVSVPPHFSHSSYLFLSGAGSALGDWKPRAIPLSKRGAQWHGWAEIPAGVEIQFKINLGDWFGAETFADGKERPNRSFSCAGDCVQLVEVENFRLQLFHPRPRTASESIDYHFDFFSDHFSNFRHLAVYLPQAYFADPNRRFPVLYALDGHNLFDRATASYGMEWGLDETLAEAERSGRLPPFIVVGPYATQKRAEEYLHCDGKLNRMHGQAPEFASYLTGVIKPFIDGRYRTLSDREHTGLLGSSFGGEFGLFAAYRHGTTFSRFGVMSPALWWSNYCMWSLLDSALNPLPSRLWIDMGDREGWDDGAVEFQNGVQDVDQAFRRLRAKGLKEDVELKRWTEVGGVHNEISWGKRAERALQFLTQGW